MRETLITTFQIAAFVGGGMALAMVALFGIFTFVASQVR
jgi:hypothetical protein